MFPLKAQDGPDFEPLFALGHIHVTPAASAMMRRHDQDPKHLLARHALGDYGTQDRCLLNRDGLKGYCEIVSIYRLATLDTIWVLTHPSQTWTLMLTTGDWQVLDRADREAKDALAERCSQPTDQTKT